MAAASSGGTAASPSGPGIAAGRHRIPVALQRSLGCSGTSSQSRCVRTREIGRASVSLAGSGAPASQPARGQSAHPEPHGRTRRLHVSHLGGGMRDRGRPHFWAGTITLDTRSTARRLLLTDESGGEPGHKRDTHGSHGHTVLM